MAADRSSQITMMREALYAHINSGSCYKCELAQWWDEFCPWAYSLHKQIEYWKTVQALWS